MVISPTRRLFPLVLMLGLAGQGLVESMLLERAVLAQTVSRVSLKLRKEPKHLDVIWPASVIALGWRKRRAATPVGVVRLPSRLRAY